MKNMRRSEIRVDPKSHPEVGLFITLVWFVVAIYHHNWIIGVFVVIMLFFTFGFLVGSFGMGYSTGFNDAEAIFRCFVLSILMNLFMIGVRVDFITGNITKYSDIFETGVYSWGSLVGGVAMLILSDEYYTVYYRKWNYGGFFLMQVVAAAYYLGMLFFGNLLDISSYKSIFGTFLVLWGLDLERVVLEKFSKKSLTGALFIVLVNLWGLKQLIVTYPEYCIF
jgi:hypothetical protein